ncbi:MAG: flagellar basal body rod protein FlgB [Ancalomicrobiaceae bacterium]|nr:flagellar basal body rod protein FlgB [Ancalomicrobiaceae bacterium]
MAVTDLPLVEALKTKMRWHQVRQSVLAENVSNADTPYYKGRDLKKLQFAGLVSSSEPSIREPTPIAVALTAPGHIETGSISGQDGFNENGRKGDFEVRPNGNAVNVEAEMVKTTENQIDFQAASALYQRGLNMLKLAIGKGSG